MNQLIREKIKELENDIDYYHRKLNLDCSCGKLTNQDREYWQKEADIDTLTIKLLKKELATMEEPGEEGCEECQ